MEIIASRQLIVVASAEAAARGIRSGMTLAQARALCAAVDHAPWQPDRDARALHALARWMTRFTPLVSPLLQPGQPPLAAIFLDVTGCERVFHGLDNLLQQTAAALRAMRLTAHLALAPTPGAAWALAQASPGIAHATGALRDLLTPLPPHVLRLPPATVATLHHLGVQTIGQLLALPREQLPARFGPELLLRLDQALGNLAEPLVPLEHRPPIRASMEFDGVVSSLEAIWLVFQELIARIIDDLTRRGCGARQLDVQLLRCDAPAPSQNHPPLAPLARPGQSVQPLPLRPGIATAGGKGDSPQLPAAAPPRSIPAKVSPPLRLSVSVFEPITDEQIPLLGRNPQAGAMELAHLIERLTVRLGPQSLARPRLLESYVPECAYRLADAGSAREEEAAGSHTAKRNTLTLTLSQSTGRGEKRSDIAHGGPRPTLHGGEPRSCPHPSRVLRTIRGEGEDWSAMRTLQDPPIAPRPLHLLPTPQEISAMVSPSHDREGRPIAFSHRGQVHRLRHAVGPERIGGQWWQGNARTRDYFDVEDESARRYWLFRVRETGKWYLHGEFE